MQTSYVVSFFYVIENWRIEEIILVARTLWPYIIYLWAYFIYIGSLIWTGMNGCALTILNCNIWNDFTKWPISLFHFYIDYLVKEKVGDRKFPLLSLVPFFCCYFFFCSLIADCSDGIDVVSVGLGWNLIRGKGPRNCKKAVSKFFGRVNGSLYFHPSSRGIFYSLSIA